MRFIIAFSFLFSLLSFSFSFLSWDSAAVRPAFHPIPVNLELAAHMGAHAALGALAALPTLNVVAVLTGGVNAALTDVDHIGSHLGLPLEGRASHGLPFGLLVAVILYLAARKGILGRELPPVIAGCIGLASVLAHIAMDSVSGDPMMPVWMPFYRAQVAVTPPFGVLTEVAAVAIVWAASAARRRLQSEKTRTPA
ncbi:MAG: hypothetical protein HY671_15525 [Chloroflexi bacterium]|nr:hypothetical protein [Chloroflexota bacterium]